MGLAYRSYSINVSSLPPCLLPPAVLLWFGDHCLPLQPQQSLDATPKGERVVRKEGALPIEFSVQTAQRQGEGEAGIPKLRICSRL